MRFLIIEKIFFIVSKLFKFDIAYINERCKNFALIKTSQVSPKDISNLIQKIENFNNKFFPWINNKQIEFTEIRWQEFYFEIVFSKLYYERIIRLKCLKEKDYLKKIIIIFFLKISYLIIFAKFIRIQLISANNISNAKYKIYVSASNKKLFLKNKKLMVFNKVFFMSFLRHKPYLEYIGSKNDKLLILGSKVNLNLNEQKKHDLFFLEEISISKYKGNFSLFTIFNSIKCHLELLFNLNFGTPYYFAVFSNFINTNNFKIYKITFSKFLENYKFSKFICFDHFELARIVRLYSLINQFKIFNFFLLDWDITPNLIRRSFDKFFVPNNFLKDKFLILNNNVELFYNSNNISHSEFISRKLSKKKVILYLANKPGSAIDQDDLRRNLNLTIKISNYFNYKLVFRPHPESKKSDLEYIYGKLNFDKMDLDSNLLIEDSVKQASLISIGISTASFVAIKSSAICFCAGLDRNLRFYKYLGFDCNKMIGNNLCSDNYELIIESIREIKGNRNLLTSYYSKIFGYFFKSDKEFNKKFLIEELLN